MAKEVTPDNKLRALIALWRQAANEATTADAAVTYKECADALEVTTYTQMLVAICEGCETRVPMPTKNARKRYPDPPSGWSQRGESKHRLSGHGIRLAAWCPACRRQSTERAGER